MSTSRNIIALYGASVATVVASLTSAPVYWGLDPAVGYAKREQITLEQRPCPTHVASTPGASALRAGSASVAPRLEATLCISEQLLPDITNRLPRRAGSEGERRNDRATEQKVGRSNTFNEPDSRNGMRSALGQQSGRLCRQIAHGDTRIGHSPDTIKHRSLPHVPRKQGIQR